MRFLYPKLFCKLTIFFTGLMTVFPSVASDQMELIEVNGLDYSLNNAPAVSIMFGVLGSNQCEVAVNRDYIGEGFSAASRRKNNPDFYLGCDWNGKHFTESNKHLTYSKLKINSFNKNDKTADITISYKLVEPGSGQFLENRLSFIVSGQHFDDLMQ